MITVYGRATSLNVQYVMWTLAEIGVRCERLDYGGAFGGTDTEEYRRMNPNRLVPVLRDGDLVLWESAAIVRYLGAKYALNSFWPHDPARRASLDKWAEWIKTTFAPALVTGIFWPMIATPEAKRDDGAIAEAVARMKTIAPILEERLSQGGPFLGGNDLTFADIMVGTPLYRYFTLEFDRADTPHLDAYYKRLTERPHYAQHAMVSYESLRAK